MQKAFLRCCGEGLLIKSIFMCMASYVHGKQGYKEYAEAFAKIAAAMVPTPTPCSAPNAQMEIIELIITKVMSKMFFTVLNFALTAKAMAITIPSPEATNILAFTHKKTPHARMMLPRMQ